jgi:hypothetical protein
VIALEAIYGDHVVEDKKKIKESCYLKVSDVYDVLGI